MFDGIINFIHELFAFVAVHEQPKFMNKRRIHKQNKFINSWIFSHLLFNNMHEQYMNTLMNIHERS